nr:hypothetical protein [uncultured Tolumonas sp.]
MKKMIAPCMTLVAVFGATSAFATEQTLGTQTGQELGVSVSSYKYEEPSLDVKNDGIKLGVDYTTTMAAQNDWFFKLNGRFAYGKVDYTGSGTSDNNPDYYLEVRPLFGKDHVLGNNVLAPYTGLGFRYLRNDSRGETSTGYWGYQRESHYYYLPVGVNHRFSLNNTAVLDSMLELDYLITGQQTSKLSDVSSDYPDLKNRQDSGYGIKFSSMYRVNDFAIGPYVDYWNINKSDTVIFSDSTSTYYGYEPKNNTVEIGIKASMRF